MKFNQQLETYLRARFTLLIIVSTEEERMISNVQKICEQTERECMSWDVSTGFEYLTNKRKKAPDAKDPASALEWIQNLNDEQPHIFILKDFHEIWANTLLKRQLRNITQKLKYSRNSIIITTPRLDLPEELKDQAVVIEFPLPEKEDLDEILNDLTNSPGVRMNLTPLGKEKILQAALGLTGVQAQRVFSRAIVENGILDDRDIETINQEKKAIIRESEALEFFSVSETPDDVGGLDILKDWLQNRERAFSQEAQLYGLPSPKGIALVGIPGTGKSLTAKMIANLWRQPLLRLDIGALFGSLVGESEERTRKALQLAETVAPCILWIDEIEKSLAHGGMDSGTSTRVFASILTWMQEKKAPVFIVATANDISSLPPELLRRGRFDEIFFLDLPTFEERVEIFAVHLSKRGRLPEDYDLEQLSAASKGYVGAEIEQAIIDAMFIGFNDRQREFLTEDIQLALKHLVPLSVSQKENIQILRSWLLEGRAQSASFQGANEASSQFVEY